MISKSWGKGSETATGTAEVVLACGVDASDCGDVRGPVDGLDAGAFGSLGIRGRVGCLRTAIPYTLDACCSRIYAGHVCGMDS